MLEYLRSLPVKAYSFIKSHPKISTLILWMVVIKIIIAMFTPLSEDFLTIGAFVAPNSLTSIIKEGHPYLLWRLIVKGMYEFWKTLPIDHPPIKMMVGFWYFIPSLSSHLLILLLKLPLIVFDILCGYLIYRVAFKLTKSPGKSLFASILWLLNPYVLLVTEMFGAYDIIVIFFMLLSILFILENKAAKGGLSLTISFLLKPYTLLLFPLYIISLLKEDKRKQALTFSTTTLIPLATIAIVLLLFGAQPSSLNALIHYYLEKGFSFFLGFILELYVSKTDWLTLYASITFTLLFLQTIIFWRWWRRGGGDSFLNILFSVTLIILAFSFWHPQLLLWILPFVIFDRAINRTKILYLASFIASGFLFEFIYFSFYFMSHGHSVFFIPNYTHTLTIISITLSGLYNIPFWIGPVATVFRSLFITVCLVYLFKTNVRNIDWKKILKILRCFEPSRKTPIHHYADSSGNVQESGR